MARPNLNSGGKKNPFLRLFSSSVYFRTPSRGFPRLTARGTAVSVDRTKSFGSVCTVSRPIGAELWRSSCCGSEINGRFCHRRDVPICAHELRVHGGGKNNSTPDVTPLNSLYQSHRAAINTKNVIKHWQSTMNTPRRCNRIYAWITCWSKREYFWLGQFMSTNFSRLFIALPPARQGESREHSRAKVTSLGGSGSYSVSLREGENFSGLSDLGCFHRQ